MTKETAKSCINEKLAEMLPAKILVAEDNLINQKIVKTILSKMGYEIDLVANGLKAVEAVKKENYDLVFMDIHMPEMDGITATSCLRKELSDQKYPIIIALTADVLEGTKEKCLDAGMNDYLSKPINIEMLQTTIEKWLTPI